MTVINSPAFPFSGCASELVGIVMSEMVRVTSLGLQHLLLSDDCPAGLREILMLPAIGGDSSPWLLVAVPIADVR